MAPRKRAEQGIIEIAEIEIGHISVAIVGTTPLICNRMSEKVQRIILQPPPKATAATKAARPKHDPLEEYRASPYTLPDDTAPTLLAALATSFKQAMMTAALDTEGVKKSQIGRLVKVFGPAPFRERTPLYGVPQLVMSVTRSADIAKTPDVRTRMIVPQWAALLDIDFPKAALKEQGILNLLARAGMFSGVGDWRTEKGSGNYGDFRLASADDPELLTMLRDGGRGPQVAAVNSPTFYDQETADLFHWHLQEAAARGFKVAS